MEKERKEFMESIDARKGNDKLEKYDIAAYTFGAEEMLLNNEFKKLEQTPSKDFQR